MRSFNGIDCLKYIMACLIVGVHTCLYEHYDSSMGILFNNIVNACVPTFFVISSFFFFNKLQKMKLLRDKLKALFLFERRTILLYVFWILPQLPYIIYINKYPLLYTPLYLCKDFFCGQTFIASWFLGAMITGMPLVFLINILYNTDGRSIMLKLISATLAIFVCLVSCYICFNDKLPDSWRSFYMWYDTNICSPCLSWPRALLWLLIGCVLTNSKIQSLLYSKDNIFYSIIIFVLFWGMSLYLHASVMRVPMSIMLFVIACQITIPDHGIYKRLRFYSIIVYCTHGTILAIIGHFYHSNVLLWTIATIIVCSVIAECILRLSKVQRYSILKYAY